MTDVLMQKGNLDTERDMYTGRTSCEDKAEVVVMLLCQRLLLNHQELGVRLIQSFSHISQEEPALPMPWLWTSSIQNCKAIHFCQLNHSVCGSLL